MPCMYDDPSILLKEANAVIAKKDAVIAKQQAEIAELEQSCINIYMALHVSQLPTVTAPVEEAWNKGQKLWLRNTKHKGE